MQLTVSLSLEIFFISHVFPHISVGTFSRRQGQIFMECSITNRAMQAMGGFAVQFNKNRYSRLTP